MMKRLIAILLLVCSAVVVLTACSGNNAQPQAETAPSTESTVPAAPVPSELVNTLADGTYTVYFNTDSSMFHVNEAHEGKGILTVADGKMTVHVALVSKSILNLYVGSAEDAKKDGAVLLQPTEDTVTYRDGYTETVYGFDIPVEELDTDFTLAIIGKKGTWYDHTVSVSSPISD